MFPTESNSLFMVMVVDKTNHSTTRKWCRFQTLLGSAPHFGAKNDGEWMTKNDDCAVERAFKLKWLKLLCLIHTFKLENDGPSNKFFQRNPPWSFGFVHILACLMSCHVFYCDRMEKPCWLGNSPKHKYDTNDARILSAPLSTRATFLDDTPLANRTELLQCD